MRIPALATLLLTLLQGGALSIASAPVLGALADLDDAAMEQVSGAGVALGFDDFEFAMAPTSYFEQVGSALSVACTGTGSIASNINCWRRGDLRWYGINISGAGGTGDGYQWSDTTTCSSSSLNCPRGGLIDQFSPFDNPYLLRAASPAGMAYDGTCINSSGAGCNTAAAPTKSIYEFLAPTTQPNYTFSWWGEIEAGSTRATSTQPLSTGVGGSIVSGALTNGGLIKSQNIIRGNAAGSIFRIFQFTETGNQTFGLFYHSYLRGDFRFSVAQVAPDAIDPNYDRARIGQPPQFANTEGLHFRNVAAFVPLGQLYYQALTVDAVGLAGNFKIELTPIPSATQAVYDKHYALNTGDTLGYETARINNTGGATTADYKLSHGYSRWGGWYTNGTVTGINLLGNDGSGDPVGSGMDGSPTGDGIIFQGCEGCALFYAFAKRPSVIDKRGETASMQRTQNYNCGTGNTLNSCSVPAGGGPTVSGAGDNTRSYPTHAVNLGDSRIEGLMLQSLRFESCAAGGC